MVIKMLSYYLFDIKVIGGKGGKQNESARIYRRVFVIRKYRGSLSYETGVCGEQYGVIPQITLVSVLCAEEYARCMEWCGLALIVSPGYCECMCRNIYCVCGGRRCLPKMCDPAQ